MKRLRVVLAIVLVAGTVRAVQIIPPNPLQTMLWARFNSVMVIDTFMVAAALDGIVVFQGQIGSLEFTPVKHLFLNSEAERQKRFDSVLLVQTAAGVIYFFDLHSLPDLEPLGSIDLEPGANDFVLRGSDMYISFGFDGIRRYRLTNYQSAQLIDSSILGVNYRQIDLVGDTLYAVDSYNGLLRYKIDGNGFGTFLDFLYLPFQAYTFHAVDSSLVIASRNNVLLIADRRTSPPIITDSVPLLVTPTRLLAASGYVVVLDSATQFGQIVFLDETPNGLAQLEEAAEANMRGHITSIAGRPYVVLPARQGGVLLFDVDDFQSYSAAPIPAIRQRGGVTAVVMHQGQLLVGGERNAIDVYTMTGTGLPVFQRTLFAGLNQVASMDQVGDSLLVLYPQLRRALMFQVEPDTTIYRGAYFIDTLEFSGIRFNSQKIDTLRSYATYGAGKVGLYTISDSNEVNFAGNIDVFGNVSDVEFLDTILVIATGKGLWVYRIYPDFTAEYRQTIGLEYGIGEVISYNGYLMVCSGNKVLRLDPSDVVNPVVAKLAELPSMNEIYHASIVGRRMYLAGQGGIVVLDVSVEPFSILAYGGRDGVRIAFENGFAAVSTGVSLHIYDLRGLPTAVADHPYVIPKGFVLDQNYPNPFNPSTTIRFTLPHRSPVQLELFNILGERVATLVDGVLSAGEHTIVWDGTNFSGSRAAAGVYLYRLTAALQSEVRKMILLK